MAKLVSTVNEFDTFRTRHDLLFGIKESRRLDSMWFVRQKMGRGIGKAVSGSGIIDHLAG